MAVQPSLPSTAAAVGSVAAAQLAWLAMPIRCADSVSEGSSLSDAAGG